MGLDIHKLFEFHSLVDDRFFHTTRQKSSLKKTVIFA